MKIIEQFRVNQLPFPKRLKDSKEEEKGWLLLHSRSLTREGSKAHIYGSA